MESGVKSQTSGIVFSFPYLMVGGKEVDLWEVLEGHGVWLRSQRDIVAGRVVQRDGVVTVKLFLVHGYVVTIVLSPELNVIDVGVTRVP